ncbi:MAG: aldo/keto reductase [Sphaerochaetaceae bacterium]
MNKKLGKTDLVTSPIVCGCMGASGAFGPQEEKDSIEALKTAFSVGINFFDTAEMYGNGYSEQLLGKALHDKRNEIVILSKVKPENLRKADLIKACERSLENLNTTYLDLYLIHWPNRDVPLEESLEALHTLKDQGKIRYYGVSNFGKKDLKALTSLDSNISVDEISYHLLFRACEYEVLPECISQEIPVLTYSSLMQGLLAGKYRTLEEFPDNRARTRMFDSRKRPLCRHGENGAEKEASMALASIWSIVEETNLSMEELAVGWLKAQKGVGGVLVGPRDAEQSREMETLLTIQLDEKVINQLSLATDTLKKALGPNIDMWDFRTK